MIDRIGFAPAPPLLVPEVASGAASELDELRTACDAMLAALLADRDHLIILAPGPAVQLGEWLANRAGWTGPLDVIAVTEAEPTPTETLAQLAARHGSTAVLVMGDGSACRTQKAPGYLDERSHPFDDTIADGLATANTKTFLTLDQDLAAQLLVAGRLVWPTIAEVVEADPRVWEGELMYRADPYGVSYYVAQWHVVSED